MIIKGIDYSENDAKTVSFCVINNFSKELEEIIRRELAKVCHGTKKFDGQKTAYSYKKTLKEFLSRYKDKTPETKMGMIGELLCHILLFNYATHLKAASPFFNMEEGSIKKGFDIIIINKEKGSFWITEVKSGELGAEKKEQKFRTLVDLAKQDLAKRIAEDSATIWYSAINNVELAVRSDVPEKEILISYLEDFVADEEDGNAEPNDLTQMNVILAPILFENSSNFIDFSILTNKYDKISKQNMFGKFHIFAIQKSTISKVENFLISESK